jgi:RND family efflux transporter MFP subunit
MMKSLNLIALVGVAGALASCGPGHAPAAEAPAAAVPAGDVMEVTLAARPAYLRASGSADPVREATLATRLMGAVTAVHVNEGDVVRAGMPLVRIDARDLAARGAQIEASLDAAEAAYTQAKQHATRMRALYADDAAPRAQLDAAEADLRRAQAGVNAARASAGELGAMHAYAVITAPFAGMITARMIDPGSFAAPGTPLLVLQDIARLRISVTAPPDVARRVARGDTVTAYIEGQPVQARIEGAVPARGSLFTVNAVVDNPQALLAPGSAALDLPLGVREQILVPTRAIVRRNDLTGIYLERDDAPLLRWVRLGAAVGDSVEVTSGLQNGDRIVVPPVVRQ